MVLSANDPVAAWGGVKLLRERFGIEPAVVTGPATDNQVGVEIIREQMQVEAFNAISNPAELGDYLIARLGLRNVGEAKVVGHVSERMPAIVLGGTGYVAGELLRLIAGHPRLDLAGILSDSQPGSPVAAAFPHLRSAYPDTRIRQLGGDRGAGCDARRIARCSARRRMGLPPASSTGCSPPPKRAGCVRIASTSRRTFATRAPAPTNRSIKHAHGAPARIGQFTCAVPEHLAAAPTPHVAHPGCFATATLLASVPLLALGLTDTRLFVTGITGSTGSGRRPSEGTHHPLRHSDLYSYGALSHRHVPEIAACAQARDRDRGGIQFRASFGPVRARHPRHRAGAA